MVLSEWLRRHYGQSEGARQIYPWYSVLQNLAKFLILLVRGKKNSAQVLSYSRNPLPLANLLGPGLCISCMLSWCKRKFQLSRCLFQVLVHWQFFVFSSEKPIRKWACQYSYLGRSSEFYAQLPIISYVYLPLAYCLLRWVLHSRDLLKKMTGLAMGLSSITKTLIAFSEHPSLTGNKLLGAWN